jgi:hypothetical protein
MQYMHHLFQSNERLMNYASMPLLGGGGYTPVVKLQENGSL